MNRRRALGIGLFLALGLLLVGVLVTAQDRRHRRFYETGKTVQSFLKTYCQGLAEGAAARPLPTVPAPWSWEEPTGEGGVAVRSLALEPVAGSTVEGDPADAMTAYLAALRRIDRVVCKIDRIETITADREVVLTVKFILDGVAVVEGQDRLLQDRLFFRWHLERAAPPGGRPAATAWRIARHQVVEGVRVQGDASGFLAVDPARVGIDFSHQRDPKLHIREQRDRLRFGVIQHAAGGLSAADYDQDGRPDLLFLDGRKSRLYRNLGVAEDGLPRFEDRTKTAGLLGPDGTEGLGEAHSAVFADFDNDGHRDLFVARYLAPNLFYRNRGDDTFEERGAASGLDAVLPATSITLLDFDRDGWLDIYLAVYGNAFETIPRLPFFARNGGANRLYRNLDGQRFEDVTVASGTGDTGWSLAAAAADFDGDGWPDLAVANDFGRKNLYRNQGDGTFEEVAQEAGVLDFSGGMGIAWGDFDNDGRADLYTSNINSNQRWFGEDQTAGQYLRNVLRSRWLWRDAAEYRALHALIGNDWVHLGRQVGEGNSLFRNRGDGTFEELHDSRTQRAGWSWGVAFADFDNDTDLDLYAANGWISGTPGTDL